MLMKVTGSDDNSKMWAVAQRDVYYNKQKTRSSDCWKLLLLLVQFT